jgi:hypothetical protein
MHSNSAFNFNLRRYSLSCDDDGDVVAATMTFLVIALAVALVLFMFWERTMNALRPLARYLGILAIFQDRGRGGSSAVSYAWWRLVRRCRLTL